MVGFTVLADQGHLQTLCVQETVNQGFELVGVQVVALHRRQDLHRRFKEGGVALRVFRAFFDRQLGVADLDQIRNGFQVGVVAARGDEINLTCSLVLVRYVVKRIDHGIRITDHAPARFVLIETLGQ